MSKPYRVGELLEVSVVKIVPNGFGLAFAKDLTIFVALAVAGDKLRVRIHQLKGKTAFAEIVDIIEPAEQRIEPECKHFGTCGGCDFQQMPYELQLEAKAAMIRDCLVRLGKIEFAGEIPVVPSPKAFGYRSRAQWHGAPRQKSLGYFKRNSDQIVDIDNCPVLTGDLQTALSGLRGSLDWDSLRSETIRIDAAGVGGAVSIFSDEIIEPTREIGLTVNGLTYFFNANIFFQGNPDLVKTLVEIATSGAAGEYALDLYCGAGLFTLPLAGQFSNVAGVEEFGRAVDFAEKGAAHAHLDNVEFYRESVSEFLSERGRNAKAPDFVLLDPPRSGTEKGTVESIIRLRPRQISYVSCEPSILARDLSIFAANGYKIRSITAIDLFPQTHHIETVARLDSVP